MAIARLWILFHCIRCDLSSWNQIESPRTRLAFEEMFVNRLWVLKEVELGDCAGCGVHKDRNIYICIYGGGGGGRQLLRSFDSKAQTQGVVVVITVGSFVSLLLVIPPSNSAPSLSTPPTPSCAFWRSPWNRDLKSINNTEAQTRSVKRFGSRFWVLNSQMWVQFKCGNMWADMARGGGAPLSPTRRHSLPQKKSTNSWREGPIGN